jgi:beta-glucosidase
LLSHKAKIVNSIEILTDGLMKKIYTLFFILSVLSACNFNLKNKDAEIEKKIDQLISNMTIEEKVGQMTQITLDVISLKEGRQVVEPHQLDTAMLRKAILNYKVGSILNVGQHAFSREHWLTIHKAIKNMAEQSRLKIPVLYGIDAIHGVTYTIGSTIFPQEIAQAATWNPALVEEAASICAYETRASYIPWNFSPVLDLGRQPNWPRIYETFGEDVHLVTELGKAVVKGYEGRDISNKYKVASCLKHYFGYGFPLSGKDRTPAWIPERFLREYFLPPFEAAVKDGALTVMVNSAEINGIPVHADYHLLTEILKDELQFKGFAVSDWEDIKYLHSRHHIAATDKEAVKIAVMAGVDMSMVPYDFSFAEHLVELAKEGTVPMSRIDDAVRRILRVKYRLGLFENLFYNPEDYPKFGSEEFRKVSLSAASEAITLLKNNNNILPLKRNTKVLITGISGNSMSLLNGGWTYTWQGEKTDEYAKDKLTVFEAFSNKIGTSNVKLVADSSFDNPAKIQEAVNAAKSCDVVLLCAGEFTYTEKPGDIEDLYLSDGQTKLAQELAKTGKPVILVLLEGRPRIISKFADFMSAILMAYLPGNEGGQAIADIIMGDVNPSGKLPITYPRYPNSLVNYDHKHTEDLGGKVFNPQFPFGFGLSYTSFAYSNLKIDKPEYLTSDSIRISIDLKNTGEREGKEVVQLYISDLYASITPAVKRLRGFEKINLKPAETKTVIFTVPVSKLAFVGLENKWITEPGDFMVSIGDQSLKFVLK